MIQERVQGPGGPGEVAEVPDVAPLPAAPEPLARAGPDRLAGLLEQARKAEGEARRAAAGELNEALDQAGRHPSRGLADLLLRWLDRSEVSGLEDGEGRTCRAAAVEALLSMGYPYALEVSPEDLEHLRERSQAPGSRASTVAALLLVALTSGFAAAEVLLAPAWPQRGSLLAALAAVLLSIVGVAFTRPRRRGRRIALVSLLVAGLASLAMATAGSSVLLVPALGAIAAFAMVSRRRR